MQQITCTWALSNHCILTVDDTLWKGQHMLLQYLKSTQTMLVGEYKPLNSLMSDSKTGVYTACRPCNNKVLQLSMHLDRIRQGAIANDLDFHESHINTIRQMIRRHLQSPQMRITIVYNHDSIYTTSSTLQTPPLSVAVRLEEATRMNPTVKSLEWVHQRQALATCLLYTSPSPRD